jgi:transposase
LPHDPSLTLRQAQRLAGDLACGLVAQAPKQLRVQLRRLLAVHEVGGLHAEDGCQCRYLPSYSPDYNPIEEAFAKIKNLLRKAAARTNEAIGVALSVVSAEDARGFFEHAGYRSTGHFL